MIQKKRRTLMVALIYVSFVHVRPGVGGQRGEFVVHKIMYTP